MGGKLHLGGIIFGVRSHGRVIIVNDNVYFFVNQYNKCLKKTLNINVEEYLFILHINKCLEKTEHFHI